MADTIIAKIDSIDQREAMLLHSQIENIRKKMAEIVKEGSVFFVFRPINYEIQKTSLQYKRIEVILFNRAYPESEQELSKEQETELSIAFKNWRQDWVDEKMYVYSSTLLHYSIKP